MVHGTPASYSIFPKEIKHDKPVQRPGSSHSMEQTCYVKMVEVEHRRARSDPPISSYLSSFARLRRTISAPVNQQPQAARSKRSSSKESKSKSKKAKGETIMAPIKMVYEPEILQSPPPTCSASTDLNRLAPSPNQPSFTIESHDDRDTALPLPPPPPGQHVPRPLSTLEEEIAELEANEVRMLPTIQLNDCKPWTPHVIESPTRVHAVAPPPLKLRVPIKEATPAPLPLTLDIPAKEQRPTPGPASNPSPPTKPSPRPRTRKHVRFVPTKPEIITPASTKAAVHYRAQSSRGKPPTAWSAVFLLSAPSSENDANNRPSTSPGPQPTPQQNMNRKSILRRSNSHEDMRQEPQPEDPDSDVEIKPLEDHVYFVINAAMEKNLKRLPRNKPRPQSRKDSPLPALPVFSETPPTPTHNPYRNTQSTAPHFEIYPDSPPSPPLPLSSRKFRHPVVVNHPPSPPMSVSSRDGSPAASERSTSSEREEMMFKMLAPEPLQISRITIESKKAGKKEERVGRGRVGRAARAVA